MENKLNQEWIKDLKDEFDNKQRLFLNGKYHSTEFNKWFDDKISQLQQSTYNQAIEEAKRAVGEIRFKRQGDRNTEIHFNSGWNSAKAESRANIEKLKIKDI
jgi:hypothetical protein